eukprot:TRINITY_DN477_c0_g1_i12.p2 TRINITY_DN477_c0_g1~~TRINITY_DN477_c0_g1_i12.p2  ORF type:complete len:353 (-),score=146.44 TRINITY_DN477_c0_g1_i12:381-1439(-)
MKRRALSAAAASVAAIAAVAALAATAAAAADEALVSNLGGLYTRTAGNAATCPPSVVHEASRNGLQAGVFYVDHANISMNGSDCAVGGRATLFTPSLLANASAITDLEASARNDAAQLLGNPLAAGIMAALRADEDDEGWLGGYEEQERVCGGYRWPAALSFLLYTDAVEAADVGFSADRGGMVVVLPTNATCVYAIDDDDRTEVDVLPAVGETASPEEPEEEGEGEGDGLATAAPFPTMEGTTPPVDNDGATCFPADAVVATPAGLVRVDALAIGDTVTAAGGGTTTVFLFTHAAPPSPAEVWAYVRLTTASGRSLTVTPSTTFTPMAAACPPAPWGSATASTGQRGRATP